MDRVRRTAALGVVLVAALAPGCSSSGSSTTSPSRTPSTAAGSSSPAPSFAAPRSFEAGKDPEALAVADVDGDGRPDVVTADSYGDTASVLLGNGDGTLAQAVTYPVGRAPASAAMADLNGDGALDLVTTNGGIAHGDGEEIDGSDDVTVLLGGGDGSFGHRVDHPAGAVPMGTAIADVDGDGALDVLVVNRHDGTLTLLLGDGKGGFPRTRTVKVPGLELARRLTVTDVNGDGAVDVLVPDESSASIRVMIGHGDGSFASGGAFPTGGIEPVAVAVGDVDGDGAPDLVSANGYPAYDVSVLLGDGQGSFGEPTRFGVGYAPHSVVATDLNGDGIVDIAAGNVGDATVSILVGRGDGTFADAVAVPTGSAGGNNTIAVADVNGDGAPDLLTANYKPASDVTVLLQRTAG